MTLLQNVLPINAVARAELLHQQRSARRRRLLVRWVNKTGAVVGFIMAAYLFWGEFAGALLGRDAGVLTGQSFAQRYNTDLGQALGGAAYIFCGVVLTHHFALMMQTLTLAANSISRERQAQTWDMLILTGMDARQIVRGKWAATVRYQWPRYLFLGVLRAGALLWFVNSTTRAAYGRLYAYYYSGSTSIILPSPLFILLAGAVIIALTLLNLGFTAACGVLASASAKRSLWALLGGIVIRLALPFGFVFGFTLLFGLFQLGRSEAVTQIWSAVAVSLLDNGSTFAGLLASITIQYTGYNAVDTRGDLTLHTITAILGAAAVYAILTAGLLSIAERRAMRERALPPRKPTDAAIGQRLR